MKFMQPDGHSTIGEISNDLHEVSEFILKSCIQSVYTDDDHDSGSNPSLEI